MALLMTPEELKAMYDRDAYFATTRGIDLPGEREKAVRKTRQASRAVYEDSKRRVMEALSQRPAASIADLMLATGLPRGRVCLVSKDAKRELGILPHRTGARAPRGPG